MTTFGAVVKGVVVVIVVVGMKEVVLVKDMVLGAGWWLVEGALLLF